MATEPDTSSSSTRAYEFLDFNSPMDDTTAAALVEEISLLEPKKVVDIGCGWAELLLRVLEACPDATGLGIESDPSHTDRGMKNASLRGLSDRFAIRPSLSPAEQADIALCIGSEHVFGTLQDALRGLHSFVRPGGRLLLGTLFWEQSPTAELSADFAEVTDFPEILDAMAASNWRLLNQRKAAAKDWDHFEFGYMRDWEQLIHTADSEGEATHAQSTLDDYRNAYLRRRRILGFVFLTLG